jgi:hypothetical protein
MTNPTTIRWINARLARHRAASGLAVIAWEITISGPVPENLSIRSCYISKCQENSQECESVNIIP